MKLILINLLIKYQDIIKNTVQINQKFMMLLYKIENKNLTLYFNFI